jgi:hypothetical protein
LFKVSLSEDDYTYIAKSNLVLLTVITVVSVVKSLWDEEWFTIGVFETTDKAW